MTSKPADEWERAWQKHWSKVGLPGYELPVGGPGGDERDFLAHARTPAGERARLKRINGEFERVFEALYDVGPAVTVFGSARFKETHPYYKLARATGAELAEAGFATLTGGGPGIMEAANREAHEAGGASYGLNIILPHEQAANHYVDSCVEFHYFFTRKVCLVKYSCAFIVMPGGARQSRRGFRSCDADPVRQDRAVSTDPDGGEILAGDADLGEVHDAARRFRPRGNRLCAHHRFAARGGGSDFAEPPAGRRRKTQTGFVKGVRPLALSAAIFQAHTEKLKRCF